MGTAVVLLPALSLAGTALAIAGPAPQISPVDPRNEDPLQPLPCRLKRGSLHTVSAVVDAETLRLDDGRLIRLIGALPPLVPLAATSEWPPSEDARQALAGLVLGRSVRLYYPEKSRDRYGRTLAHAVVELQTAAPTATGAANGVWVQAWLVRNGHARAYVLPGNAECAAALVAHESHARSARLGLWALAAYTPQPSWATRRISRLAGTFQLIEGRVTGIGSSRGNLYLNFGRRRRSAFSVFVAAEALRENPDWKRRLETLEGRHVRVRGWIEQRNGPFIEVTDESQIEVIGESS